MKKLLLVGLVLIMLGMTTFAQKYQVVDLGTLGGDASQASGINKYGQIVGAAYTSNATQHAFLYSNGLMQDLGTLGGNTSQANAINEKGEIVGLAYINGGGDYHAFLYASGSMQDLGTLGGSISGAWAINTNTEIAGYTYFYYFFNNAFAHAFLYSNGNMQNLGTLNSSFLFYSYGYGINDAGQVVGESSINGGNIHAFLYSNGTMQDLGTLGGISSQARDINNNMQIVGNSKISNGSIRAFLYSNGTMQNLGTLGNNSYAWAINDSGQIVGYSQISNNVSHAFLYSNGLMQDLNNLISTNSGWILQQATAINDNGQIVGSGTNSLGQIHALLLNPLSEGWDILTNLPMQPTYTNLPSRELDKDNLVVITHGRIPFGDDPQESSAWVYSMTNDIGQYLTVNNITNWQVYGYLWTNRAKAIVASILEHGHQDGVKLGECIATQGWTRVHFIAHSAGSALIQSASEKIKSIAPNILVHCTFLDPFVGILSEEKTIYGKGTDWAEHYYSVGDLPFTESFLPHAYNVDVTQLNKVNDPYAFISTPLGMGEPCKRILTSHSWPISFYSNTITGGITPEYGNFGFSLSSEGGNWDYATNTYPVGNMSPQILGTSAPNCISFGTPNSGPGTKIDFSQSTSVDSPTGTIQKFNSGIIMHTESPVWTSVFTTITNPVNFVSFDVEFVSTNVAEGLLSVYWDANVLGSVDERAILPGLKRYTLGIPKTAAGTLHMIGFRLDPFSVMASSVSITNVVLGYAGVSDPFKLAVVTNTPSSLPVFELSGQPGFNYSIEASTNLVNWDMVIILVNTNGSVRFFDQNSTNYNQRFYRAVAP